MTTFSTRLDTPQHFGKFASRTSGPSAHVLSRTLTQTPQGASRNEGLTVVLHGPPGSREVHAGPEAPAVLGTRRPLQGLFSSSSFSAPRDLQGSRETNRGAHLRGGRTPRSRWRRSCPSPKGS